jgi:penicillin-binding protein 1A
VYFGDGAYGIGSAARVYFGTEPDQLTPSQAAFLAGRIRAPEQNDVRRDPNVGDRRDQVLANMHAAGWLDEETYESAVDEPLQFGTEAPPAEESRAPHFVEFVKRQAMRLDALGGTRESRANQLFTGGYTIETTFDIKQFDAAHAAVADTLGEIDDPSVAVVTVEPGDGAIRNLFGGLTFERKFDVASQGRRQPGSAFKPLVYLAALREGIDPRSTFDGSSPQTFEYRGEPYEVNNYEGQAFGPTNVDDGLVHSVNTVYVGLGLQAGPPAIVRTALDAHAPADEDAISSVASVALGGLRKGVTPLEMAAAYATFAARGTYAEPYAIARIRDRDDRVVYEHERRTEEVFSAVEVGVLNNAMLRVVREGTGRAAAIDRPLAGKTGTTQEYGDAWFTGYVPQLSTAVWVGHPEEIRPMLDVHGRRVSGGSFPAMIFQRVMQASVAGLPVKAIETASPDQLALRLVNEPPPTVPESSTTSTTSSPSTTSTQPPRPTPTSTSTTRGKREEDTTTTSSSTTTASTTSSSTTTTSTTPPP